MMAFFPLSLVPSDLYMYAKLTPSIISGMCLSTLVAVSVRLSPAMTFIQSGHCRASDFPRSRKSRGIRGIADLKRNLEN